MEESIVVSMHLNATVTYAFTMGIEITCLLLIEVILLPGHFIAFSANAVLFIEAGRQVVVKGSMSEPIEVDFFVLFDAVAD